MLVLGAHGVNAQKPVMANRPEQGNAFARQQSVKSHWRTTGNVARLLGIPGVFVSIS